MTKSRRRSLRRTVPSRPRRLPRPAIIAPALALVIAAGFWWGRARHSDAAPPVAPTAITAVTTRPDPQKLIGRWVRPDGGYVVEVRSVDPRGKMEVAYFNPNPIHVARAEALQDAAGLRVDIELRDAGYPGSTYTLTYDPTSDQLQGIYYHAGLRQLFQVVFVRVPARP